MKWKRRPKGWSQKVNTVILKLSLPLETYVPTINALHIKNRCVHNY